ncbi:MAG: cysteine hydrolase family protein [Acidimicrobiia bacterium]
MANRTVFWDVDTQFDFMHPKGSLYVHGAERLVPALARLTAGARAAGVVIVHSADDHDMADDEIDASGGDFVDTFPPHCLTGTEGAARIPETEPAPGALDIAWDGTGFDASAVAAASEIILRKKRFDVFSNPSAAGVLSALAPGRVVVYGVALDICDRYAVEGMLRLGGFEIVVVSDAVASIVPSNGRRLLREWQAQGVAVATADDVLAGIG